MAEQKVNIPDHHFFRRLLENSFDAIVITDTHGNIILWNSVAHQLFGYASEDVVGKKIGQIFSDLDNALNHASNGHEVICHRKDGVPRPMMLKTSSVSDEEEKQLGNIYTLRDLSETVKNKEAIDQKNRAMDMFMYSVSHDLRAPLRRIVNYAQILQEDHAAGLTPEIQNAIERMTKNTEKMGELLDALVSLSRVSQAPLHKNKIDMLSLATAVSTSQKTIANAPGVKVKVDNLPEAFGDFNLIKLALEHLLANAIKFSRASVDPSIDISAEQRDDRIVYCVKDNGAGFDNQYANKLFGVFQRLHNPSEFEGIGIGLAIVHQIITRHGGNVWGEGKANKGATFYFSLPRS